MGINAIVAQSGGPTSVMNATLSGVIEQTIDSSKIGTIYGARYGIEGVIKENIIDLKEYVGCSEGLKHLSYTPGAALGSCRYKLQDYENDESEYKKIMEVFLKHDAGYFFYIGGNDSMDTVNKLSLYFEHNNYPIKFIGVPKTIDNDLMGTDHTPGFGSAAKYVATTMQEIIQDCMSYSFKSATVVEIMGRDSGWLTAASQLGRITHGDFPDLVYLPETEFDLDCCLNEIKEKLDKKKHLIVAIAEGVKNSKGDYIVADDKDIDGFGHKHLTGAARELSYNIRKVIGCKTRFIELNIMQRCSAHLVSEIDYIEAKKIGKEAVKAAINGQTSKMLAFLRNDKEKYEAKITCVDLGLVANLVKKVELKHIDTENHKVTDELLNYIKPLTTGEMIFQPNSNKRISFL